MLLLSQNISYFNTLRLFMPMSKQGVLLVHIPLLHTGKIYDVCNLMRF